MVTFCSKEWRGKEASGDAEADLAADILAYYEEGGYPRVYLPTHIGTAPFVKVLASLFHEIYEIRGGFYSVVEKDAWADVKTALKLPTTPTSTTHQLKRIYKNVLLGYERERKMLEHGIKERPSAPRDLIGYSLRLRLADKQGREFFYRWGIILSYDATDDEHEILLDDERILRCHLGDVENRIGVKEGEFAEDVSPPPPVPRLDPEENETVKLDPAALDLHFHQILSQRKRTRNTVDPSDSTGDYNRPIHDTQLYVGSWSEPGRRTKRRLQDLKERLSSSQGISPEVIKCACGVNKDVGSMIECSVCHCWSHSFCAGFEDELGLDVAKADYRCFLCSSQDLKTESLAYCVANAINEVRKERKWEDVRSRIRRTAMLPPKKKIARYQSELVEESTGVHSKKSSPLPQEERSRDESEEEKRFQETLSAHLKEQGIKSEEIDEHISDLYALFVGVRHKQAGLEDLSDRELEQIWLSMNRRRQEPFKVSGRDPAARIRNKMSSLYDRYLASFFSELAEAGTGEQDSISKLKGEQAAERSSGGHETRETLKMDTAAPRDEVREPQVAKESEVAQDSRSRAAVEDDEYRDDQDKSSAVEEGASAGVRIADASDTKESIATENHSTTGITAEIGASLEQKASTAQREADVEDGEVKLATTKNIKSDYVKKMEPREKGSAPGDDDGEACVEDEEEGEVRLPAEEQMDGDSSLAEEEVERRKGVRKPAFESVHENKRKGKSIERHSGEETLSEGEQMDIDTISAQATASGDESGDKQGPSARAVDEREKSGNKKLEEMRDRLSSSDERQEASARPRQASSVLSDDRVHRTHAIERERLFDPRNLVITLRINRDNKTSGATSLPEEKEVRPSSDDAAKQAADDEEKVRTSEAKHPLGSAMTARRKIDRKGPALEASERLQSADRADGRESDQRLSSPELSASAEKDRAEMADADQGSQEEAERMSQEETAHDGKAADVVTSRKEGEDGGGYRDSSRRGDHMEHKGGEKDEAMENSEASDDPMEAEEEEKAGPRNADESIAEENDEDRKDARSKGMDEVEDGRITTVEEPPSSTPDEEEGEQRKERTEREEHDSATLKRAKDDYKGDERSPEVRKERRDEDVQDDDSMEDADSNREEDGDDGRRKERRQEIGEDGRSRDTSMEEEQDDQDSSQGGKRKNLQKRHVPVPTHKEEGDEMETGVDRREYSDKLRLEGRQDSGEQDESELSSEATRSLPEDEEVDRSRVRTSLTATAQSGVRRSGLRATLVGGKEEEVVQGKQTEQAEHAKGGDKMEEDEETGSERYEEESGTRRRERGKTRETRQTDKESMGAADRGGANIPIFHRSDAPDLWKVREEGTQDQVDVEVDKCNDEGRREVVEDSVPTRDLLAPQAGGREARRRESRKDISIDEREVHEDERQTSGPAVVADKSQAATGEAENDEGDGRRRKAELANEAPERMQQEAGTVSPDEMEHDKTEREEEETRRTVDRAGVGVTKYRQKIARKEDRELGKVVEAAQTDANNGHVRDGDADDQVEVDQAQEKNNHDQKNEDHDLEKESEDGPKIAEDRESDVDDHEQDVDDREKDVSDRAQAINTSERDFDDHEKDIDDHEKDVDDLEKDIDDRAKDTNEKKEKVLDTEVAEEDEEMQDDSVDEETVEMSNNAVEKHDEEMSDHAGDEKDEEMSVDAVDEKDKEMSNEAVDEIEKDVDMADDGVDDEEKDIDMVKPGKAEGEPESAMQEAFKLTETADVTMKDADGEAIEKADEPLLETDEKQERVNEDVKKTQGQREAGDARREDDFMPTEANGGEMRAGVNVEEEADDGVTGAAADKRQAAGHGERIATDDTGQAVDDTDKIAADDSRQAADDPDSKARETLKTIDEKMKEIAEAQAFRVDTHHEVVRQPEKTGASEMKKDDNLDTADSTAPRSDKNMNEVSQKRVSGERAGDAGDRVREAEDEIHDAEGEIAEADGEIDEADGEVGEPEGEVDGTEGNVGETGGEVEVDRAEGEVDGAEVEGEVDGAEVEGEVDGAEVEGDGAEGEVDRVEGEVDSAEGEVDDTEGEVDETEGEVDETEGEVDEAEGGSKRAPAGDDEAEGEEKGLREAGAEDDEAEGEIDEAEGEIPESWSKTTGAKRKIDETENGIERAEGEIEVAEGEIDEAEVEIDEAEGDVDEAEGEIAEAEGEVAEAEDKIDEAEGKIDETEGKIDETEGKIDKVENKVDRSKNEVEEVVNGTDVTENKIDEAMRTVDQFEKKLDEVDDKVDVPNTEVDETGSGADMSDGEFDGAEGVADKARGELLESDHTKHKQRDHSDEQESGQIRLASAEQPIARRRPEEQDRDRALLFQKPKDLRMSENYGSLEEVQRELEGDDDSVDEEPTKDEGRKKAAEEDEMEEDDDESMAEEEGKEKASEWGESEDSMDEDWNGNQRASGTALGGQKESENEQESAEDREGKRNERTDDDQDESEPMEARSPRVDCGDTEIAEASESVLRTEASTPHREGDQQIAARHREETKATNLANIAQNERHDSAAKPLTPGSVDVGVRMEIAEEHSAGPPEKLETGGQKARSSPEAAEAMEIHHQQSDRALSARGEPEDALSTRSSAASGEESSPGQSDVRMRKDAGGL